MSITATDHDLDFGSRIGAADFFGSIGFAVDAQQTLPANSDLGLIRVSETAPFHR